MPSFVLDNHNCISTSSETKLAENSSGVNVPSQNQSLRCSSHIFAHLFCRNRAIVVYMITFQLSIPTPLKHTESLRLLEQVRIRAVNVYLHRYCEMF